MREVRQSHLLVKLMMNEGDVGCERCERCERPEKHGRPEPREGCFLLLFVRMVEVCAVSVLLVFGLLLFLVEEAGEVFDVYGSLWIHL